MKEKVITFFLLWAVMAGSEVSALSIGQYVETARSDYTLDFQKEKVSFLESSSSNTPILNEIQFSVRSDEFDRYRNRFRLRFSPNGWGEARDGKRVYDVTLQYNETQYDLLLNRALKRRYLTVVELLDSRARLDLEHQLMLLYQDKINVLKKSVNNLDFDARDLIEAEDDALKQQLDLIALENKIVNIEDEIRQSIAGLDTVDFDTGNMADFSSIQSVVESLDPKQGDENIHIGEAGLSANLARERLNLEISENRRYIDYFEATYDMADRDDLEKALSLGIAFTLPIVNPNRLDINRRKLQSLREKRRYEDRKRDVAEDMTTTLRDLKRLLKQHDVLTRKKQFSKAEASLKTYMQMEGVDPLILLSLKESMLKTEIAMKRIHNRIFTQYIDLLDISGKLIERPLVNYLSINLEPIGQ